MIKVYLDWNIMSGMKNNHFQELHNIILNRDKFLLLYSTSHIGDIFAGINPIFGSLSKLKGLRDTNQHLEERTFQIYNYPELPPIYGTISWYAKKKENELEGILTTIYSGTIFRNINAEMGNPAGKENQKNVNDIKFEGIERAGKNDFVKSAIYINHIIDDIKQLFKILKCSLKINLKVLIRLKDTFLI